MRNIETQTRTGRPRRGARGRRCQSRIAAAAAGLTILLATAAITSKSALPAATDAVAGPVAAEVTGVIDGDTIAVRARIWLGQNVDTKVRLMGVDTPELRGACAEERGLAAAAREFVVDAVRDGDVILWNIRYDKFGGRVLARVEASGGDLAALLIAAGFGRAYDGGKREPWCGAPAPAD